MHGLPSSGLAGGPCWQLPAPSHVSCPLQGLSSAQLDATSAPLTQVSRRVPEQPGTKSSSLSPLQSSSTPSHVVSAT